MTPTPKNRLEHDKFRKKGYKTRPPQAPTPYQLSRIYRYDYPFHKACGM